MATYDGNEVLRQSAADGIEARWVARTNLVNTAPAFSALVKLA
jgi:hypothetical protein